MQEVGFRLRVSSGLNRAMLSDFSFFPTGHSHRLMSAAYDRSRGWMLFKSCMYL